MNENTGTSNKCSPSKTGQGGVRRTNEGLWNTSRLLLQLTARNSEGVFPEGPALLDETDGKSRECQRCKEFLCSPSCQAKKEGLQLGRVASDVRAFSALRDFAQNLDVPDVTGRRVDRARQRAQRWLVGR